MADLSDVIDALANLASTAVYPNGINQPSAPGCTVSVVSGWPIPEQLDDILAAGNAVVSVYAMPELETNTTRFASVMEPPDSMPSAQLTLTVSGNQITVGGTINGGESATIAVNYQPYSHRVTNTDTTATIASALAALIPNATAVGCVITLGSVFDVQVAVSVPVTMQSEIARQRRVFLITAWCPTPALRTAVIRPIDVALKEQPRIVMSDNTYARLIYRGTLQTDELAKQRIYRRDLRYEIEYITTATEVDNTVTNLAISISLNNGAAKVVNI